MGIIIILPIKMGATLPNDLYSIMFLK